MQHSNQQDTEGTTYETVGLALGRTGLDLRQPSGPETLTRLLNARFIDDRCLKEREGHTGVLLRDASTLAPLGDSYTVTDEWFYGHGLRVSSVAVGGWENAHHPFPGRGVATFNFDGSDVVFTGDRLLVLKGDGAALGQSAFWQRGASSTALDRGIPAYLPLQVDSTPPAQVTGQYVATCLTKKLRVYLHDEGTGLEVWLVDRETGAVIHTSNIAGGSTQPVDCRIVNSGEYPVAIWRDAGTHRLYENHWTGTGWSGAVNVVPEDVYSYDIVVVDGGFHLLWRTGSPSSVTLCVGYYARTSKQSTPYVFGTALDLTGVTINGGIALGIAPDGGLAALVNTSVGLYFRTFQYTAAVISGLGWQLLDSATAWNRGLAVVSRGLRSQAGLYSWVTHAASSSSTGVYIREITPVPGTGYTLGGVVTRWNSALSSKSFRVGDEVFAWLRSRNTGTHYLVAGAGAIMICGYADREEAINCSTDTSVNYCLPHVLPDPLTDDGTKLTWARLYNTGQQYAHGGNVRIGDLDFVPEVSTARFGKGVYLSGSAVKIWDGVRLNDAGFQTYPVVKSDAIGTSIGTAGPSAANVFYRVYAVRYTSQGERVESAATTYTVAAIDPGTGTSSRILTIAPVPDTNHDDVILEVYRTESNGTAFYLEGTAANDMTTATITYTSDTSDADLIKLPGDPHAAGIGAQSELEAWGPLGCAILSVTGDRLWGAGGQVPAGIAQFSKLRNVGEVAGFDDLAGYQTVDPDGHPLTSVIGVNDITVLFQADKLHLVQGTGPDNYGRDSFAIPQIVLAGGASTHTGTILTQAGVFYYGSDGPRVLPLSLDGAVDVSLPIRDLSRRLVPSGVRADLSRQEVVWYTQEGSAILLSYLGGSMRWSQWSGLEIAGCSSGALITTDGRLLRESPDAVGDDGAPFEFAWATGNLRPEEMLQGGTLLRSAGIVGEYVGSHRLRMRIYYNGAPCWTDEWVWEPETNTWLTPVSDVADLTPAEVDALKPTDRSGSYATHKRVTRQTCRFFRVEVTNLGSDRPTYIPFELSLELGVRPGLGRIPVNTFR